MRNYRLAAAWLSLPAAALSAALFVATLAAQENSPQSAPAESTQQEKPQDDAPPDTPGPESPGPESPAPQTPDAAPDSPAPEGDSDSPPPKTDTADNSEEAQAFREKLAIWRDLIKKLRNVIAQYQTADEAEHPALQAKWDALIAEGNELIPDLRATGLAAYKASPNTDRDLAGFLVKLAEDDINHDQYESALNVLKTLIENDSDRSEIYGIAGAASYSLNDFDSADEYFEKAGELSRLSEFGRQCALRVDSEKELWEREQELRAAEAEADDLPRVKLTTDKGEIIVELFENEAPQTVGNFVSLVESGFYDNQVFHRVLPNFMAQTGSPEGKGIGGPGYRIPCECDSEDARKHFRGSLSMAHAGKDTGGSQFFITFRPTPELDGVHTVFGRVIEGMDVLADLQRRNPDPDPATKVAPPESSLPTPSKFIKAEVIRKRKHEYKPTKID